MAYLYLKRMKEMMPCVQEASQMFAGVIEVANTKQGWPKCEIGGKMVAGLGLQAKLPLAVPYGP